MVDVAWEHWTAGLRGSISALMPMRSGLGWAVTESVHLSGSSWHSTSFVLLVRCPCSAQANAPWLHMARSYLLPAQHRARNSTERQVLCIQR